MGISWGHRNNISRGPNQVPFLMGLTPKLTEQNEHQSGPCRGLAGVRPQSFGIKGFGVYRGKKESFFFFFEDFGQMTKVKSIRVHRKGHQLNDLRFDQEDEWSIPIKTMRLNLKLNQGLTGLSGVPKLTSCTWSPVEGLEGGSSTLFLEAFNSTYPFGV